jgi:anti-sigma factor ChrR (cupin superfamily)
MDINSNFAERLVLNGAQLAWQASPVPGVERQMLDRVGDELARATSFVRYAPNTAFTPHAHDGGEEILVLDGCFADEAGEYPAGSYLRNPPGSMHAPYSETGCTLFVKLRQFDKTDTQVLRVDTNSADWYPGLVPGLSVMPLHEHDGVSTALVRWAPHTIFNPHVHPGGEEILVLDGVFYDEFGCYPKGSWIRSPRFSKHAPFTKGEGALIYVKVGHFSNEYLHSV